jgi:hypothetical protein
LEVWNRLFRVSHRVAHQRVVWGNEERCHGWSRGVEEAPPNNNRQESDDRDEEQFHYGCQMA